MNPRNTVLVRLPWSLNPPTTSTWLDDSCTVVHTYRGSGKSPVVTLIQKLVRGTKIWTALEAEVSLCPPNARRLPLRLAAADAISGVSGRVFQTDMWLADWSVGEIAF